MNDGTRSETELELELGPERSMHRHPLDPISLALGAVFTLLGGIFLFGDIDAATLSIAWAWAALCGTIGLLLIAVAIKRSQRR